MVWGPNVENAALLYKINFIVSSLSLCGSLCMTYFCFRLPSPKSVFLKFLIGIALADILYSIVNFMSIFERDTMDRLCFVESILRIWAKESSLFFAACIALLCYKTSRYSRKFDQNKFFTRSLFLGAVLCTLLTSAPLYLKKMVAYTNGDLFCYITYVPEASLPVKIGVRLIYEGILVLSGVWITTYGYFRTVKYVRRFSYEAVTHMDLNMHKLFWYPVLIFVTFMPSVIDNFAQIFYKKPILSLQIMHLCLTHSIGLTNAIVYGLQRRLYVNSRDSAEEASKPSSRTSRNYSMSSTENELVRANGYHKLQDGIF